MPLSAEMKARRAGEILTRLIQGEQWTVYAEVVAEAARRQVPVAIGGGLATSAYCGCLRNTKDMDLFLLERDHREMRDILRRLAFEEYLEVPYDPTWSYRGTRNGFIVDLLWRMLNGRAAVDENWVTRGVEVTVRGVPLRLLGVEELIWSKLYIMRRDRCDWPDILNLLFAHGVEMDWRRFLESLGEDRQVIGGAVSLLAWMCPGRVAEFPSWILDRLGVEASGKSGILVDRKRVALFKGDDWFREDDV